MSAPTDDAAEGPGYDTLVGPVTSELKVQRSRFLAEVHPIVDEQEARSIVAAAAKQYHDARHVCFAWRLGPVHARVEHRSDAGEPSGSAGEPILNALRQAELSDTVAVVVRWFGGVKLGTGGLGRAYRDTVAAALDGAAKRRIHLGGELEIIFPYSLQKTVNHHLEQHGGRRVSEVYADDVVWRVWLPSHTLDAFDAAVTEAGQGRLQTKTPE